MFSDSHGFNSPLETAIDSHPDIEHIIFLGDGLADIEDIKRYYNKRFYIVRGNCDFASGLPVVDTVTMNGKKILFTHGHTLDVKYTTDEDYRQYVGCELEKPLAFLSYLTDQKIPTTLRQVIIPKRNDSEENAKRLKKIADAHPCIDKIELLPFRKICQVKYDAMGREFAFAHLCEPSREQIRSLEALLNE